MKIDFQNKFFWSVFPNHRMCFDGFSNFHVFVEGLHPRLGQTSPIRLLDPFMIRYIHTTIKQLDQYRVSHLVDPILADTYYEELNSRGVNFYTGSSSKNVDTFKSVEIHKTTPYISSKEIDQRHAFVFTTNISYRDAHFYTKIKMNGLLIALQQIIGRYYTELEAGCWTEENNKFVFTLAFKVT
jgi:hypothetical protein